MKPQFEIGDQVITQILEIIDIDAQRTPSGDIRIRYLLSDGKYYPESALQPVSKPAKS